MVQSISGNSQRIVYNYTRTQEYNMDAKTAFNATVCVVGIAFLLIHTVDLLLKNDKRKDEKNMLIFIVFTIVHFATYLTFTFIKINYTSNPLVISFYTTFYIMNNIELLLLFNYTLSYISLKKKTKDIASLINVSLFVVFVLLDITNIFNKMFFHAENGDYTRSKMMILSQGYQLVAFALVFLLTAFNRKLKITEKVAFAVYCLLPFIAIIIQNLMAGYAVAYLSIIIAIEILFLFVNVKKNIELANEAKRTKEAEVKLMVSQIQPHFIYNTLSSISTLIKIDPEKAQKGLDAFTEYLRANLTSINETGLTSFENELKHIETYLSLEKMRFDERLNVSLDIKVKDFLVPPLTIQPIVENAVKHGILKKIEGGTINIKTYEDEDAFYVEVNDDGVGFDVNDTSWKNKDHVGINNVNYRLSTMCRGELIINSEVDKGTTAVVKFYK